MRSLARSADSLLPEVALPRPSVLSERQAPNPRALPNRKTVLHLIPNIGGGGAEAMMANLVTAFDPAEWQTVVVAIDGRPWPAVANYLRKSGAEVVDLERPALARPNTMFAIARAIRRIKPDVVQTWMHHADLAGGWCARMAGARRVVWGIHCREIHRNPGDGEAKIALITRALSWSARRLPRRIVSCSAVAMDDHARLGYPRQRMVWIPNGIDTARFVPNCAARSATRHDLRLPTMAPVIGYAGRFHEMKDLATWLRAAALLQARHPEMHYLLCGGSEMELGDCARAALSIMPRRNQVHFAHHQAHMEHLYPALDVFSLSSRTEACPMTLMEASACGIPCVATDVGDCARLLDGIGHVVAPHDPEALARAWEEALQATDTKRRALRRQAVQRFDIATAAQAYARVYGEVVAE